MSIASDAAAIIVGFKKFPAAWEGKNAVTEMKNGGSTQWKQMEWIGFYFEHLCRSCLNGILKIPGPKFGNTRFDAEEAIPWDFKSHVLSGKKKEEVVLNDKASTAAAIKKYGAVGAVVAVGVATFDSDLSMQKWHETLKGKRSAYTRARIKRGAKSRRRKATFEVKQILLIKIDKKLFDAGGTFKQGRNSNGKPRPPKLALDLSVIPKSNILKIIKV